MALVRCMPLNIGVRGSRRLIDEVSELLLDKSNYDFDFGLLPEITSSCSEEGL